MKYSANLLPLSQARPGDIIVKRRIDEGDTTETVVIRPSPGKALVFDSKGLLVVSNLIEAVQQSTPLTGATVVMTDDDANGTLEVTPAGTIAALTVTLPTNARSRVGQIRRIVTSQIITALTVNGATTIGGNVTTLAANAFVSFEKTAANTWRRIG